MYNINLYNNYVFTNQKFKNYKYTDNRKGVIFNYVAYMRKGNSKIVSDRKTINISEGDIFYIPKGLSYESYWYGEPLIDFISLGFDSLNIKDKTKFELQVVEKNEKAVEKILKVPLMGNIDCASLSKFYDLMEEVYPLLVPDFKTSDEANVRKIKNCIQNNPFCTLSEIADMCLISEPYLYFLFKKNGDITPNEYKQKTLCKMATNLLTTTDKSIEEIANELHFSSSSYFRKIFKKHIGTTPKEIRKNELF